MIRAQALQVAMACLGTPFRHQGRVPGLGLDCAGLLVHVFRTLDLPHHDELGYPRNPYDGQLETILDSQLSLRRISLDEAEPGDVLVMRVTRAPQHIAFLAEPIDGQRYIVHASSEHGATVHHRLDDFLHAKLMRAYRLERPA